MSEYSANLLLMNTAGLAIADDPLEQTQVLPIAIRRERQREARLAHVRELVVEGVGRTMPAPLARVAVGQVPESHLPMLLRRQAE